MVDIASFAEPSPLRSAPLWFEDLARLAPQIAFGASFCFTMALVLGAI